MYTDTSWIIVRHPYAFLPHPWQVVLCKRDMTVEILPGIQERRYVFTIDVYNGRDWLRKGSGHYEYWTHLPDIGQWCPPHMMPPPHTRCVYCLNAGQYAGLHIGQIALGQIGNTLWQIREPNSTDWTTVLSKNILGWLLLPATDKA
jgi:hypothetical protein